MTNDPAHIRTTTDGNPLPQPKSRANYLGMTQVVLLDMAVMPVKNAFGTHPYLVGSAGGPT